MRPASERKKSSTILQPASGLQKTRTKRSAWDRVGGFDDCLRIDFNDVDYCLRLRQAGLRIVFTPYATLYHHESASFGPRSQNPAEVALFRERWGALVEQDPYYHPELTRDFPDYRLRV